MEPTDPPPRLPRTVATRAGDFKAGDRLFFQGTVYDVTQVTTETYSIRLWLGFGWRPVFGFDHLLPKVVGPRPKCSRNCSARMTW